MTVSPEINVDSLKTRLDKLEQRISSDERSLLIEPWKVVSYSNSIASYDGGANWYVGEYTKDRFGFVHCRGLIRRTSGVTSQLFTLPVGYRPRLAEMVVLPGRSSPSGVPTDWVFRGDVNANGVCTVSPTVGQTWDGAYLSISAICFYAEQ